MVMTTYGMTRTENEIEALIDSFAVEGYDGASTNAITAVVDYFSKKGIDFVYDEWELDNMTGSIANFAWVEDGKPRLVTFDVIYNRGYN